MKQRGQTLRAAMEALESRRLFSSLNILTRHGDYQNDGANPVETVLTPSNANSTEFGKQFSSAVDGGDVIAAPLYMQNVDVTAGSNQGDHSVVFVATEAAGLFALDANTGATLWHDNFTNITDPTNLTPTTGVTTILQSDIDGNPDVGSQLGILATPAIDTSTNTMYVLANTKEIRSNVKHFVQRLWAVSINSGAAVMSPAVIGDTIAPDGLSTTGPYTYVSGPIINGTGNNDPYNSSGGIVAPTYPDTDGWTTAPGGASGYVIAFNAIEQMERPALTLLNGTVYMGFASHGDDGPYYGWLLGYSTSNLTLNAAFVTTPTFEPSSIVGQSQPFWNLGGIWMSGAPISTDGTNLYVVTGNGAFNGDASNFNSSGFPIDHDYGDTVLKLSLDSSTVSSQNGNGWGLKVADYFTPSNQLQLNNNDLDLGSGGATLLPNNLTDSAGNPMLVVGGKESRIYLLDRNNLGKYNYNYPSGSNTVNPASYDHVVAEYANNGLNQDGEQIYSSATYYNGNFYIGVDNSTAVELNVAAFASGTFTPIHTSFNFGYPAETFIVSSNGNTNGVLWVEDPGSGALLAFNASSFTNPIYSSNTNSADALGGSIHFHSPTEADGMVYAGSRGGGLAAYGLDFSYLTSNPSYFAAPTNLTAKQTSPSDIHLGWTNNSSLATELQIQRSVNGQAWTTLQYVASNTTSYDDTTIAANTIYQYRVIAVSGPYNTTPSNTVTVSLPLTLTGSAYYLRLDPNGINLDLWSNTGPTGGTLQSIVLSQIPSITFNGSGATSNLTVDFSNGDPLPTAGLTFNGSGISTLTLIGDSGNDSLVVSASTMNITGAFGTAPITYSGATSLRFIGGAGSNTLTQTAAPGGGANVAFGNINGTDTLNVSAGSMTLPMPTSSNPVSQLGTLLIGPGAQVSLAAPTGSLSRALLEVGSLGLAGSAGNWMSRLDLAGNDLLLHNSVLATLDSQVRQALAGNWSGMGLTSSAAANDSAHLTALGVIVNNDGAGHALYGSGAPLGLFDGISPAMSDTLIRQTYFGDTNLDGTVDGSDYSRIDAAYLGTGSGWFNGDFNYDQSINGSDYTLIDNAFNRQGLTTASSLAITTATQAITTGATSSSITVQLRNALGAAVNAPVGGVTVNLTSSSAGAVFLNGLSTITSILIPAGFSSVNVQYKDSVVGTPVLTFYAAGLSTASQSITILAAATAAQLAFTTSPLNQAVGSTSNAIGVSIEDANGNAVAAISSTTLNLSSSDSTGIFTNASGGVVTSLSIPAGSSLTTFKYSDTTRGIATLTVSAAGLTSTLQQETISAALSSISFTTPAHRMILGASPATVTIQLEDQAGNPYAAGGAGVLINLGTNSSGGTFYNSANVPVTSVTVPAGASSISVAYRDTQLGSPTLTASATGLLAITQQQTVIPLPAGTVAYYGFNAASGFLSDTSGSGNTLVAGGGTVSYSNTNLPAGFTGAASFSNNGYLSTSTGSFPVNVPTGNSTYTIGAWIDINNANKNGIVGWGNWGSMDQVDAFRTTQGDAAPDGAGLDNYWWGDDYVQPTANLVGNWEYVATTYNGTYRSIYVNGQLAGTYTSANQDNAQPTNFHVGVTNNGEFFGGTMADLIIANTAFSANQISELYNAVGDAPASIAFTTPPHTMIVGASPITLSVQLDDHLGNPISPDSPVTVNLSTNSSGGHFYNSSNARISSITIPAGSSTASVTYTDTQAGSPTITAYGLGLTSTTQQQTVSPLPAGTVAYWGFNTSAGLLTDVSGSGNTLQVAGGTVAYTSTGLLPGFTGAAAFSNNGYLTAASNAFPVNVPTGNLPYTIAAWIDINNTSKNGIVGWGNWGTTDQVNAFRTTQGDTGAADGAGLDNYWWNDDYVQSSTNLVNNWVYAAVTYDGIVRTIYANGVALGTFSSLNKDNAIATNFAIGTTSSKTEFFNGDMADLLIADGAFTPAQIDALYNGT